YPPNQTPQSVQSTKPLMTYTKEITVKFRIGLRIRTIRELKNLGMVLDTNIRMTTRTTGSNNNIFLIKLKTGITTFRKKMGVTKKPLQNSIIALKNLRAVHLKRMSSF